MLFTKRAKYQVQLSLISILFMTIARAVCVVVSSLALDPCDSGSNPRSGKQYVLCVAQCEDLSRRLLLVDLNS